MTKKFLKISLLLAGIIPIISACSSSASHTSKSELLASSRAATQKSKAISYSKYAAMQSKLNPISIDGLNKLYELLKAENNAITGSSSGYYGPLKQQEFNLRTTMQNKFLRQSDRKSAYDNALASVDNSVQSINDEIKELKGYRDNRIVNESIDFFRREKDILKQYKTHYTAIYKGQEDTSNDNIADIELALLKLKPLYKRIANQIIPILQQEKFNQQSEELRSQRAESVKNSLHDNLSHANEERNAIVSSAKSGRMSSNDAADIAKNHHSDNTISDYNAQDGNVENENQ